MLFRQMKYFSAVVERGSFTEAAEQCYISQSAVSQQIRALEKELGVELLHRETIRIGQDEESELRIGYLRCYSGQELHQAIAEVSVRSRLARQEFVTMEDLKHQACILIPSREQQNTEEDYFRDTLGFGGRFLFAENLEEGRLMVAGNRGFLPIESVGTLPPPAATVKRLPIMENGKQLQRNYCLFWVKEHTNYYIEEFAETLRKLLKG